MAPLVVEAAGTTEGECAGVPVIASRIGGIPKLIGDGFNGILVPPGDVNALAAAPARIHDQAAYRTHLQHGAAATVDARFSPATFRKAVCRVTEDLCLSSRTSESHPALRPPA